jgi:putative transcriptional regulator
MAKKKYRSDALGALHESATDLYKAGLLDTKTMREFDASCLTTVEKLSPRQITSTEIVSELKRKRHARPL